MWNSGSKALVWTVGAVVLFFGCLSIFSFDAQMSILVMLGVFGVFVGLPILFFWRLIRDVGIAEGKIKRDPRIDP